jgi:hypothetical protein
MVAASEQPKGALTERTPDKLDLENSRRDIVMVTGLARSGLLTPEKMAELAERLEKISVSGKDERIRLRANEALAAFQNALMGKLVDVAKIRLGVDDASKGGTTNNQQINIYLPSNGRESLNGHDRNGKH